MGKLDYEKLDYISKKLDEAIAQSETPTIEDQPYKRGWTVEEFEDLTDEEIEYIFRGVKPE